MAESPPINSHTFTSWGWRTREEPESTPKRGPTYPVLCHFTTCPGWNCYNSTAKLGGQGSCLGGMSEAGDTGHKVGVTAQIPLPELATSAADPVLLFSGSSASPPQRNNPSITHPKGLCAWDLLQYTFYLSLRNKREARGTVFSRPPHPDPCCRNRVLGKPVHVANRGCCAGHTDGKEGKSPGMSAVYSLNPILTTSLRTPASLGMSTG